MQPTEMLERRKTTDRASSKTTFQTREETMRRSMPSFKIGVCLIIDGADGFESY